jgi:hypothetical protein
VTSSAPRSHKPGSFAVDFEAQVDLWYSRSQCRCRLSSLLPPPLDLTPKDHLPRERPIQRRPPEQPKEARKVLTMYDKEPLHVKQPGQEGLMCEMLWTDPQDADGRGPSKRGVGLGFLPRERPIQRRPPEQPKEARKVLTMYDKEPLHVLVQSHPQDPAHVAQTTGTGRSHVRDAVDRPAGRRRSWAL